MHKIRNKLVLARRSLRLLGRLIYRTCTQNLRVLPDFYAIGPPRSGTTSLYHYLSQHQCYVRPFMKELGYSLDPVAVRTPIEQFNYNLYRHMPPWLRGPLMSAVQGLYYCNGARGYRKHFPLASAMKRTKQLHGNAITGEFTVFGLYNGLTTEDFPFCLTADKSKFITILRNPVDFLYSLYTYQIDTNFIKVNREMSFDQFIHRTEDIYIDDLFIRKMNEMLRQWRPIFEQYSYFDERRFSFATFLVSYVVFVKHWASKLPPDRFLVLNFADLCERTQETMNSVFDFLELPYFEVPDLKPINANKYADKLVAPETASYIAAVTRPYNEELYEFLGRDLEWT